IGLRALLTASGLTEADLQLDEIGYNAPALLCTGRVEAAVIYTANEPVTIRDQCGDVTVIDIWPLADLLANGLISNERTLAENPDLVRGMVRALAMGIADTLADPDAALEISRGYVEMLPQGVGRMETSIAAADVLRALSDAAANGEPILPEQAGVLAASLAGVLDAGEVVQMRVLRNALDLWRADRPGYTDPVSWQVTLDTLVAAGLLAEPFDLAGAYTNEFLPE
ncbi:MAG: ABC transporter substrate-binding protein, partial [Anaerolineae bacterium]|nr:ABC transporter substrate-binding protein [Anaerolineae bacterium]